MTSNVPGRLVVFGIFKGMGDLLSVAPVIASELGCGTEAVILTFPQIVDFVDLLDFGVPGARVRALAAPIGLRPRELLRFYRAAARISPALIWISPHTPSRARSWKIPLFAWLAKSLVWRGAILAGAKSERLSWLFNERVPVDRNLPFTQRERAAFGTLRGNGSPVEPRRVGFKQDVIGTSSTLPELDLTIFPGAGALNRKWPLENYGPFLSRLPSEMRVAICAVPEDMRVLRCIVPSNRRIELLQVSLPQAVGVIARSRVIFCMDSGPMFFAEALGIPVVAIFGASDPKNVVEPTETLVPIYEKRWRCQPCGNSRCIYGRPYCVTSIEPSGAAEAVLSVFQRVRTLQVTRNIRSNVQVKQI